MKSVQDILDVAYERALVVLRERSTARLKYQRRVKNRDKLYKKKVGR